MNEPKKLKSSEKKVDCKANYEESAYFFSNTTIHVCFNSAPPGARMNTCNLTSSQGFRKNYDNR